MIKLVWYTYVMAVCQSLGHQLGVWMVRSLNLKPFFYLFLFIRPSYPPSQASPSSFAMWGTAFLVEWLSPSHDLTCCGPWLGNSLGVCVVLVDVVLVEVEFSFLSKTSRRPCHRSSLGPSQLNPTHSTQLSTPPTQHQPKLQLHTS